MSKLFQHHRGQMSEAFRTVMFLSASGGLQDAYTYIGRGKVFANAQTGNIVLMSQSLFDGDLSRFAHYFIPVLSFALGVAAAECIRLRWRQARRIHWRQLVVLTEIVLLFAVGFFPAAWDIGANALVSFSCAMQVQAFRKVRVYQCVSAGYRGGDEKLTHLPCRIGCRGRTCPARLCMVNSRLWEACGPSRTPTPTVGADSMSAREHRGRRQAPRRGQDPSLRFPFLIIPLLQL